MLRTGHSVAQSCVVGAQNGVTKSGARFSQRLRTYRRNGRRFGEGCDLVRGQCGALSKGADEQSSRKGARAGNGPGALVSRCPFPIGGRAAIVAAGGAMTTIHDLLEPVATLLELPGWARSSSHGAGDGAVRGRAAASRGHARRTTAFAPTLAAASCSGLEFLVGADIIATVTAPLTWESSACSARSC